MIRLLVVASVRLYREGLAHFLDSREGISVVGTAEEWRSVSGRLKELAPDIVVFDLAAKASLGEVRSAAVCGGIDVVAVGVSDVEREVLACAEAGVAGYVTRAQSLDDLVSAITSVSRGEALCSPKMTAALLRRVAHLSADARADHQTRLTKRELEIVGMIDEGLPNKVIAQRLCIELATVKNHVHNILGKLNVAHRWEAAAELRRAGVAVRKLD